MSSWWPMLTSSCFVERFLTESSVESSSTVSSTCLLGKSFFKSSFVNLINKIGAEGVFILSLNVAIFKYLRFIGNFSALRAYSPASCSCSFVDPNLKIASLLTCIMVLRKTFLSSGELKSILLWFIEVL